MPQSPQWDYRASPYDWRITDCLRILRLRKAALLSITCMAALGALAVSLAQPRTYQSRALVEIRAFNENFLSLRNIYPTLASKAEAGLYIQTQTELLEQDSLIEQVAGKLHLERRPEFQPPSALLGKLRDDIRFIPLRNTRIIQIVCDARDASLAADLANTVARTFIEQSIENRQRGARQTYESLQSQLEELTQGLPRQAMDAGTHSSLRRVAGLLAGEGAVNRHVYKTLLQQANDARTASLVRQSNIELIAPAEPPVRPSRPNLPLNLAMGIADGLVLAIGFIMLYEQNTPVLRAPGEAATFLALPELGAIPTASAHTWSSPGLFASARGKPGVERAVLEQPWSCLSESVRGILTSILSSNGDHPQIVVVTSSRRMEGKTTTVSNLGLALAEIGYKTLLIDGDVSNPRLHAIFDQSDDRAPGGKPDNTDPIELPLDGLVKKTGVPHLFLLACGTHTDAILGLSYPGRTSRLFERLREDFDYVLVDTPPCLEFAVARNLARYADALTLVVRANYTDRRMAQAAVERFEDDGTRVTGVILNRWNLPSCDSSLPRFLRRTIKIGNPSL
jgi:receptor protein-tyrosine kinase